VIRDRVTQRIYRPLDLSVLLTNIQINVDQFCAYCKNYGFINEIALQLNKSQKFIVDQSEFMHKYLNEWSQYECFDFPI